MRNGRSPLVRSGLLLSVVAGVLLSASSGPAGPAGENSASFQIELPEAQIAATDQVNINLESTDVKLIPIHILRPDADNIDYGQIFPKVNGAAASRIAETRPAVQGKLLRLDLHQRPGFELLPGNNLLEVQATDHHGRTLGASFNLHTPAGACRGAGRAKILELPALVDLARAGVTMDRLIQLVVECGVKFQATAETDQRLQDAGAEPKLLAAIHNPAAPEFREYSTHAIKLDALLELLRDSVSEQKIISSIEDNGVGFQFTPAVEEKLRAAGASQKVIQTVRYMTGAEATGADAKALSLAQIMQLLQGGAVQKNRIFDLVEQRGVSFRMDRTAEDRLREAGANEKLMRAIREAADSYATRH
jgi:hypothetical protein